MQTVDGRIVPDLPADAFKTWQIVCPPDLRVRAACEDAGCVAWAYGWESAIDESTTLGVQQAAYIRGRSGRTFTEARTAAGVTVFRFASHQRCFTEHHTRRERFFSRGGDWRGNPRREVREYQQPADWVGDFTEHQQMLVEQHEKG